MSMYTILFFKIEASVVLRKHANVIIIDILLNLVNANTNFDLTCEKLR